MAYDILTRRLTLRPWRESEVERYCEIYQDERVWKWLGANPTRLADATAARARIAAWQARRTEVFGVWAIEAVDRPLPLGTALLLPMPDGAGKPTHDVEIGWHLAPDAWGHGYATEAAEALLDLAWQFAISRVHAVIYPGNDASVAVAVRLGMRDEGLTDAWYGTELRHFSIDMPSGY